MAIIPGTLRVILPKRSGADADDRGRVTAELSLRIQFQDDNPEAVTFDVYNYPEIPRNGELYHIRGNFNPEFVCRGAHAERLTDMPGHWWEVEARYRKTGIPEGDAEFNETSLSFSSGTIIVPTVAKYDYFGQMVQNSAGQQFDPPAQYDRRIATFKFTREEYRNPNWKRLRFEGAVNSVPIWGLPKHTVKVNEITASKAVNLSDNPSKTCPNVWNVSYELAVDLKIHGYTVDDKEIYGWQTAVLDCGKMEFESEDDSDDTDTTDTTETTPKPRKLVRILDDNELEIDEPQRLNGKGQKLDPDERDVYLRFMLHHLEDLNALNLPDPNMV